MHISGGNVGTLLVPLVGAYLITRLGWRSTVMLFAIPGFLIGLALLFFVRDGRGAAGREAVRRASSMRSEIGQVLRNRALMLIIMTSLIAAGGRGLGAITIAYSVGALWPSVLGFVVDR